MAKKREGDMTGLVRRGAVFWMRVRVPTELVPILRCRERCFSLRTSDRAEALNRHSVELSKLRAEFALARQQLDTARPRNATGEPPPETLGPEQIRDMVLTWFHETEVRVSKADREMIAESNATALKEHRVDLQADETALLEEIGPRDADTHQSEWAHRETDRLLTRHGVALDPQSDGYRQLRHYVARGLIESIRRRQSRLSGNPAPSPMDPLFAGVLAENPAPARTSPARGLLTVSELAERFIAEHQPRGLRSKTLEAYRLVAGRFAEVVGDKTAIPTLGREDFVQFRDVLCRIPANAGKRFPGLNLQQVATLAMERGLPPMSARTINKTFETLSSLFRYAEEHDLVAKNHARKLSISEAGVKKRLPFTDAQLSAIFTAPLYTGCKNDGHGFATKGIEKPRRARFWIPLIGLFSGMRLNEICQLYVEDVKVDGGIHYFAVRTSLDDGSQAADKRLKTPNAERLVPIHPELERLGFLAFAKAARRDGRSRLFPEVRLCTSGTYSDTFQKWFSRFLRQIKGPEFKKVSFHSFRHTFRDALRNEEIPTEITNRLCGWEESAGMAAHYGSGPSVEVLSKWVRRVRYLGLNLDHLVPSISPESNVGLFEGPVVQT